VAALEASNQKHIAEKLGISHSVDATLHRRGHATYSQLSVPNETQKRKEYLGTAECTPNEDVSKERKTARFSREELAYKDDCSQSVGEMHDQDFLGSGSFSAVYKGKVVGKDVDVAVKVVDPWYDALTIQ
jgi:hypothetical protein